MAGKLATYFYRERWKGVKLELELIILKIAGILSAIGVIWKFGLPIFQRIKKRFNSQARLEKMIENGFNETNRRIQNVEDTVSTNRRNIIKMELLSLIRNEPQRAESIENLFTDYRNLGGNSYVCEIVEVWREIHERNVIKERIKK